MNLVKRILSVVILVAGFATSAQANLILNGSFEDTGDSAALGGFGSANTWQIYSVIPSWEATQTMEIWTNNFIVPAYDGKNILELNAHPATSGGEFSISQNFATQKDQVYKLSFAGRKRQANKNESFSVSVGDFATDILDQASDKWTEYSYQFVATGDSTTLTFTSLDGGRDTTGNLLDAVNVIAVPEPGPIALISLGLLGLVGLRLKRASPRSELS
jgi:hypothetical protein